MPLSQDGYQKAIAFAARAHGTQRLPGGDLPYVVHVANVAMEVLVASTQDPFDVDLAVTCALLHDTLEDTATSESEIERAFGAHVSRGVRALTKDASRPKEEQMRDSLARIAQQPREIAIVKLADRVTNLQPPPEPWTRDKRIAYREQAREILATLGAACAPLAGRLAEKIEAYGAFVVEAATAKDDWKLVNAHMAALDEAATADEAAGRYAEALAACEKMLRLCRTYQHGLYQVDILDRMASLLRHLGREDEAFEIQREANSRDDYDEYLKRD
jgi:tetratricopeptide (TPR) repeat protein